VLACDLRTFGCGSCSWLDDDDDDDDNDDREEEVRFLVVGRGGCGIRAACFH